MREATTVTRSIIVKENTYYQILRVTVILQCRPHAHDRTENSIKDIFTKPVNIMAEPGQGVLGPPIFNFFLFFKNNKVSVSCDPPLLIAKDDLVWWSSVFTPYPTSRFRFQRIQKRNFCFLLCIVFFFLVKAKHIFYELGFFTSVLLKRFSRSTYAHSTHPVNERPPSLSALDPSRQSASCLARPPSTFFMASLTLCLAIAAGIS